MLVRPKILIHVEIHSCLNGSGLAEVIKYNVLMTEQTLKHIWNLELLTCSCPLSSMLTVLIPDALIIILSNIYGIIHQAHALICRFMLKRIAIFLTKLHDELDNIICRIRNLNRVCLNVSHFEATLLDFLFQIDHEQSTTLSHDIVVIPRIAERILKRRCSVAIYAVNHQLKRSCQRIHFLIAANIRNQSSAKKRLELVCVLMLDSQSCFIDLFELLSVIPKYILTDH